LDTLPFHAARTSDPLCSHIGPPRPWPRPPASAAAAAASRAGLPGREPGEAPTDLDCSGYDCRASGYTCADALLCGVDADCLSGQCTNVGQQTRCTSCNNGVKDGLESGVDCGGEECGGCGDGLPCGAA